MSQLDVYNMHVRRPSARDTYRSFSWFSFASDIERYTATWLTITDTLWAEMHCQIYWLWKSRTS